MLIVYLALALGIIAIVLIQIGFTYPELLIKGAKGLLHLGIAFEKQIAKILQPTEKQSLHKSINPKRV